MEKNQEIIRDYIDGRLSDIDRRAFENILATDAELAAEVQLFRDLRTVSEHKDLFDLKQKLREIVENTPIKPDLSGHFDENGKYTEGSFAEEPSVKMGRRTWLSILGASVVTAIAAFFLFQSNETKRIQNIAQQFDFQPFENVIQFDSTDARPLAVALKAYNQGAYAKAEPLLTTHLRTKPADADAAFYLGMCQALTGQFEVANRTFETTLIAANSALTTPAKWYSALCFLRLGAANKARPLLTQLKIDVNFGEKARRILAEIGE